MLASEIQKLTKKVTKEWTEQRIREERHRSTRLSRQEYVYSTRINHSDVAGAVIPAAYLHASGNGEFPASQRQIYYAAREAFKARTGRPLGYGYFSQTLLRRYLNEHPETSDWNITRDPRGILIEPHTKRVIPIGTLAVDEYLETMEATFEDGPAFEPLSSMLPTLGFRNRYQAVLYIEKEGFNELFKHAEIAERFDIAIMTCKGQSVIAARKFVDHICHLDGIPLLVVHDFDKAGFEIAQNLTSVSWAAEESNRVAYEFENEIRVIDLGLRLADVEKWNLQSERVTFKGGFDGDTIATEEEQRFLRTNRRVELNAFTSPDFIAWIESKLEEHSFDQKLVPDDDTLAKAFRRAIQIGFLNNVMTEQSRTAHELASKLELPDGFTDLVRERLQSEPTTSWDEAVAEVAEQELEKLSDSPGDSA